MLFLSVWMIFLEVIVGVFGGILKIGNLLILIILIGWSDLCVNLEIIVLIDLFFDCVMLWIFFRILLLICNVVCIVLCYGVWVSFYVFLVIFCSILLLLMVLFKVEVFCGILKVGSVVFIVVMVLCVVFIWVNVVWVNIDNFRLGLYLWIFLMLSWVRK